MRSQSDTIRPPHWDTSLATDFAITTINVPDRLDMQEVRARADEDEERPRRRFGIDRYTLHVWFRRFLWLGVLAVIVYFASQFVEPARHAVSPAGLAEELQAAIGRPVVVRETEFRFTPTPRWVASGVEVAGVVPIEELSLHFNWRDAWRAVRGGGWVWGEATVAPLKMDAAQAIELLATLQGAADRLPSTISTIRFEEITFSDVTLLPGRYEVTLRRGSEGRFGALMLAQLGSGNGRMQLTVSATPEDGEHVVEFALDAADWRIPFGPQVPWSEVVASGRARPNLIEVDKYSFSGFFAVTQGALAAARDVEWVVTGYGKMANLDLEAVLKHLRGKPSPEEEAGGRGAQVPMSGTANLNLVWSGRGDTLQRAIDQSVVSGPVSVRWAQLNGINLGYAAMHPSASGLAGGVTRFSELDASLVAAASGLSLGDIHGRAGAMSTRGEIRVSPDAALSGQLRVDLGGERVQAPLNVRVRGTVLAPQFGR